MTLTVLSAFVLVFLASKVDTVSSYPYCYPTGKQFLNSPTLSTQDKTQLYTVATSKEADMTKFL